MMEIKMMQEHIERLEKTRNIITNQLQDFVIDSIITVLKDREKGTIEFPEPMDQVYCEGEDTHTTVYGLGCNANSKQLFIFCTENKYLAEYFDADTLIVFFYKLINEVI